MAKEVLVDPRRAIRITDSESNKNYVSTGIPGKLDFDQSDYLKVIINEARRRVGLQAVNDGEVADRIPLVATTIPDFEDSYVDGSDCQTYASGEWTVTQATTGTVSLAAAANGIIELDSASATADQGVQIQRLAGVGGLTNRITAFGCRLKITDAVTGCQMFAGLVNTDTSIIASGAVAANDWIGFFMDAAGTPSASIDFGLYDGVSVEEETGVHTAVEDTYVNLEFITDGVTAWAFVDGTLAATITIDDLPSATYLRPSFVCQTEGTVDPILSLDWWYAWQTRISG